MSTDALTKNPSEVMQTEQTRSGTYFRPNVDIEEKENELLLIADVPGARRVSIEVNFEEGSLTIHAAIPSRQQSDQQYLLREYGTGDYCRTFQISEAVDASKITAECADGVLTLHLPKADAVKPRKIPIQAV
jgi:HSP20 family protein